MENIELSIVVPIYNVEKYLRESLDSLYKVKIPKEIILVDDKSTDNSYKIIEEYKEKYPAETIVINHEKNRGISAGRNSGIEAARGRYISFIDSDDIIIPAEYEKLWEENKNLNLDIIMGHGYLYWAEENKKERLVRDEKVKDFGVVSGKEMMKGATRLKSHHCVVWLNFYKADFLRKNNLYFYEGLLHEDELFSFLSFYKAEKVKYNDIDFYLYRQREGSIMHTKGLKNKKCNLFVFSEMLDFLKKENIKDVEISEIVFKRYWAFQRKDKVRNKKLFLEAMSLKTHTLKSFIQKVILVLTYPLLQDITTEEYKNFDK